MKQEIGLPKSEAVVSTLSSIPIPAAATILCFESLCVIQALIIARNRRGLAMSVKSILVATVDQAAAEVIRQCLGKDFKVECVSDMDACLEWFKQKRREYTFIDIGLIHSDPRLNARAGYREIFLPFWEAFPKAPLIVLTEAGNVREAVEAVKAGADSYLSLPLDPVEVSYVINSIHEYQHMESELEHLRDHLLQQPVMEGAQTNSALMREVLDNLKSVAATKTTVLLTGETGVGKGVLAKLIHHYSNRAGGPFVEVHCGAIPDTLLESEFFGHEKGAFTGALRRKLGKFQIGHSGTVFLDEIGTMTPSAQIKMLQVLQERRITRVGGESPLEIDVRLIAATNMDLKKLVQDGLFRQDLFFRLNVFPIEVPPLRERSEDIPLLVETMLERLNRTYNKDIKGVSSEVMAVIKKYSWPGNIRELEHLIERAYILEKSFILTPKSFPVDLFSIDALLSSEPSEELPTLEKVRRLAVEQIERRYLREILTINKGRVDQSARVAGISPRQLHNLMHKFGLKKEEFK